MRVTPAAVIARSMAASSRCARASFIGFAASGTAGGLVVDDCGDVDSDAHPDITSSTAVATSASIRELIARQIIRKQHAAKRHFELTL